MRTWNNLKAFVCLSIDVRTLFVVFQQKASMNATILYVEACKCMLSISDDSPNSWMELFQLLPKLRQALSCRVCRGLLVDPFGSQSCEHYVCRGCLRKKRSLNPGCRWCLNMDNLVPDQQTKILLACYQKLCEFVTESRAVGHLRSQNGEYSAIVAVIHEAMASPISMDNGSQDQKSDQQEAQANNNNNISSAKSNKMAEQSRGIASKLPAEVIVPLPKRKIIQLLNEMDGSEEQKPQRKKRKHFKGTIYNYNKKKKFKKIADATDLSTQIVDNQIRGRLCRCGVSSIGNSKRCVGKRCPCFSKEKSCEHCACCNCANPFNNNNVRLSNELKPILEDEVCVTES
ncbi:E3 ubiquitin-protein ligase MSL2 [Exaiptasia diaphana]|nr:E3 ubiquitin-protein ligase MSL2 [Exaiptasia diaphana]